MAICIFVLFNMFDSIIGDDMKKVLGFENYYLTNDLKIVNIKTGKIVKEIDTGRGYKTIVLYKNGKRIPKQLHRIVCEIYNPVEGMENLTVDHIDGDKTNNRPENLEFVTVNENIKRYWRNLNKTFNVKKKVDVYNVKTKEFKTFDSHYQAAKYLKIDRYEMLRRLHVKSMRVFRDYTMVKYHDGKSFEERYNTIPSEITKSNKEIILFNHLTKELRNVATLKEASEIVKRSCSVISSKINTCTNHIFDNGWEVKHACDNRKWSEPSEIELLKITSGGLFYRPITIKHSVSDEVFEFNTCKEASKFLGIKPTTFNYRIQSNPNKVQKDGYIYSYK